MQKFLLKHVSQSALHSERGKWKEKKAFINLTIVGPVLYAYNTVTHDFCAKQTFRVQNYFAKVNKEFLHSHLIDVHQLLISKLLY